jgi:hypothetical protein
MDQKLQDLINLVKKYEGELTLTQVFEQDVYNSLPPNLRLLHEETIDKLIQYEQREKEMQTVPNTKTRKQGLLQQAGQRENTKHLQSVLYFDSERKNGSAGD